MSVVVAARAAMVSCAMVATSALGQGWPGYPGWDPCQYQWCPQPAAPRHHFGPVQSHHRKHVVEHHVEKSKPKPRPRHIVSRPVSQDDERNAIHERVIIFCRHYQDDPACPKPKPEEPKP